MQNKIETIFVITVHNEQKEKKKTSDLLYQIHSGRRNNLTSKKIVLISKKTLQINTVEHYSLNLLCN